MQKDGKAYVCTPYQPFGGGSVPPAYGTAAAAPAAADASPLSFPGGAGSPLGLPAPAPAADSAALTDAVARQYVQSFREQQPAAEAPAGYLIAEPAAMQAPATSMAAAQAPALDPSVANLFEGQSLRCVQSLPSYWQNISTLWTHMRFKFRMPQQVSCSLKSSWHVMTACLLLQRRGRTGRRPRLAAGTAARECSGRP